MNPALNFCVTVYLHQTLFISWKPQTWEKLSKQGDESVTQGQPASRADKAGQQTLCLLEQPPALLPGIPSCPVAEGTARWGGIFKYLHSGV